MGIFSKLVKTTVAGSIASVGVFWGATRIMKSWVATRVELFVKGRLEDRIGAVHDLENVIACLLTYFQSASSPPQPWVFSANWSRRPSPAVLPRSVNTAGDGRLDQFAENTHG
jgi:hypothetical protein